MAPDPALPRAQEMASNPEVMKQMQEAMAAMTNPETQQELMRWAQQVQERVKGDPSIEALARELEGADLSNMGDLFQKIQQNPTIRQLAEEMRETGPMAGLSKLMEGAGGGAGLDTEALQAAMKQAGLDPGASFEEGMRAGQEAMAKLMQEGGMDQLEKLGEEMAKMMPPEALANMEQYMQQMMNARAGGAGGMDGLYKDEV